MRRLLIVLLVASTLGFVGRGGVPCDAVGSQPQCLVALLPGPTADTFGILDVQGDNVSTSAGQLLLTTVQIDPELSLREWLSGSFDDRVQHIDREIIYPPGVTVDQVRQANEQLMQVSQLDAILAAFNHLGIDIRAGATVGAIEDFSKAVGTLEVGDVIVEAGGVTIRSAQDLITTLERFGAGDRIALVLERGRETLEVEVELTQPEGADRAILGIGASDALDLPVEIDIDAGQVGGPSAGLMFALAIIDVLTPDDLTGGRIVAGTGEISADGTVREIGGIQQKILGATNRFTVEGERVDEDGNELPPATVFLVPERNFPRARQTPVTTEVLLVPVATLDDALAALAALRDGRQPEGAVAITP